MFIFVKESKKNLIHYLIMAEKKIVRAAGERKPASNIKVEGNSTGLRIGAVISWIIAIAMEVICVLFISERIDWFSSIQPLYKIIGTLVIDMIFVIIGSALWKKANHIDPISEKNKLGFWLWNNMGVLVACVAFLPVIIILLTNKNVDPKTKKIGTIVAGIAFAIAGISSYDFNPVSQEDLQEMYGSSDIDVYWVATGSVYHSHQDCSHLNFSTQEELFVGSIGQAEEAGKERLCKTCFKKDEKAKKEGLSLVDETKSEIADGIENVTETVEDAVNDVKEGAEDVSEDITEIFEE